MNNRLKLLITTVCIVTAAVYVVFTVRSYSRVREIDGQRMKITTEFGAFDAGLRQNEAKANAEKKRLEERLEENKKGVVNWETLEKTMQKTFSKNPTLQNRRLAAFRAEIAMSYGPFFQKMHLSPEHRERLSDALVQRQADKGDLDAILAAAGQTADTADVAWRKANQESLDALNSVAVSALGGDGAAQLERYEQDMPMWNYVGQLASIAAQSGIPISLEHADLLVALMSSATSTPNRGTKGVRMPQTGSDWAAIDEQVKTFLSKEQMDMFRSVEPLAKYVRGGGGGRFYREYKYEDSQAGKDMGLDW